MASRPPPPSGRPPSYAIASRMFGRANLRPIVLGFTVIAVVWSLIWSAGAFEDISSDRSNNANKLIIFDIIIGAVYAGVAVIEAIGFYGALSRRLAFAKVFVGLSVVVIFLVFGVELLRTIVHFSFKSTLINECINIATGKTKGSNFGFWGSFRVTTQNAPQFCNDLFNRSSFATIVWLLLATIVATLLASLAFSHYRQVLDPNFSRAQVRSDQVRLDTLRYDHYGDQDDYDPHGYGRGQIPYPTFAPPPGPPPGFGGSTSNIPPYEATKLPGYNADSSNDFGDFKEKPKANDSFADNS